MADRTDPTPTTVALHKLPPQLRMLVRLMGEAAAYRLVQARGGTPLTVPKSVRSPQFMALADLAGSAEAGAALVHELAGQTIQLPKHDSVVRQLRHQRVIELRQRGGKLAEIALATGYSMRQVINVLADAGEPLDPAAAAEPARRPQGDLFDEPV